MIISASRRTDIPAFYSDWFFNRLREGFVLVRNPFNYHQVSKIVLTPGSVDGFVFWTKNPGPMLDRLHELDGYPYYFQYTLTSCGKDIEPDVPYKSKELIDTFKRLAELIGPERVIWRYDPILLSSRYTEEYHMEYFTKLAEALGGYTRTCTISFIDHYPSVRKALQSANVIQPEEDVILRLARFIGDTGEKMGMQVMSCCEAIDFKGTSDNEFTGAPNDVGNRATILPAACIDSALMERIAGKAIAAGKDKNQRPGCGCAVSVDIGAYNTCLHGCIYCYANHSKAFIEKSKAAYDPAAPMLCSKPDDSDKIYLRS